MALSFVEFLSPKFIHWLEDLPLSDYDISHCIEDEFLLPSNFKSVPLQVNVIKTWLLEFFSSNVVLSVIGRFHEMEKSCLRHEYFVRGGLSTFALRIWRDIEDEVFTTWNEVKVCPTWNKYLDEERQRVDHSNTANGNGGEGKRECERHGNRRGEERGGGGRGGGGASGGSRRGGSREGGKGRGMRRAFVHVESLVEKLSFMIILCCFGRIILNIHVTLDHFPVTLDISCHFG